MCVCVYIYICVCVCVCVCVQHIGEGSPINRMIRFLSGALLSQCAALGACVIYIYMYVCMCVCVCVHTYVYR